MIDFSTSYIELHFCTEDGSHTMDAEALNRCVYEYLGLIQAITSSYHVQVKVEAEALAEGGVIQWLKIHFPKKDDFKKQFLLTLLVSIVASPITDFNSTFMENLVERLLTPAEIRRLETAKTKAELEYQIAWYEKETKKLSDSVNANVVVKKRSNFYNSAKSCSKINSIEFVCTDEKKNIYERASVSHRNFNDFILVSDELEPKDVEDAIIEIVSPVLKKGKYKWTGVYNGEVIQFSLKSNEFKTLVQTGNIAFKNGTSIKCELLIKHKLDSEGNEKITGYDVLTVDATFDNDHPIETPEGKRKRKRKEVEKNQLMLDF